MAGGFHVRQPDRIEFLVHVLLEQPMGRCFKNVFCLALLVTVYVWTFDVTCTLSMRVLIGALRAAGWPCENCSREEVCRSVELMSRY